MSNYMQSKQNCIHSLLLQVDRHSSQKISKDIVELNIINQLEIIDNRLFQSTRTEHTFFLSSHGAFTKIDTSWAIKHILINLEEKRYNVCSQTTTELN